MWVFALTLVGIGILGLANPAQAVDWDNCVSITQTPQQPKIGERVSLDVQISSTCGARPPSTGFELSVYVCRSGICNTSVYSASGSGTSFNGASFTLLPENFQPGQTTIQASMSYSGTDGIFHAFLGRTTFTVLAADNSQGPRVVISEQKNYFPSGGVTAKVFRIGAVGTDRVPTRATVSCGDGGTLKQDPAKPMEFECHYRGDLPRSYSITVEAFDSSGSIAKGQFTTSITTKEKEGGWSPTSEADIGGPILTVVNIIIGAVSLLVSAFYWMAMMLFVVPALQAALATQAAEISFGVQSAWEIVRNIVNMLFILVLIVMGIATILRIEGYNYKKLLSKLILMALLVNFSLVIGQAIIQVSDVVTNYFLKSANGDLVLGVFDKVRRYNVSFIEFMSGVASTQQALAVTGGLILELVVRLLLLVTFVALAFYSLVRFVGLWLLLILSPFAYFFAIIPKFSNIASSWWQHFLRYVFFVPIMTFFLFIALNLPTDEFAEKLTFGGAQDPTTRLGSQYAVDVPAAPGQYDNALAAADGADSGQVAGAGDGIVANALRQNMKFILMIAVLWGGLMVAAKSSVMGSGALMGMAKSVGLAPLAATAALGGFAGAAAGGAIGRKWSGSMIGKIRHAREAQGKIQNIAAELRKKAGALAPGSDEQKALLGEALQKEKEAKKLGRKAAGYSLAAMLNPRVLKDSWKARAHDKEEEVYSTATAQMHDRLNAMIPWDKRETYFEKQAVQKSVNDMYRELAAGNHDEQETARITLQQLANEKNSERVEGVLKYMISTNRQDDVQKYYQQNREKFAEGSEIRELGDKYLLNGYDSFDFDRFVSGFLEKRFGRHEATDISSHLQEFAEGEYKPRSLGMVVTDDDTGEKIMNHVYEERYKQKLKAEDPSLSENELNALALEKAVQAKWGETRGRMMRGDSEKWAKAIETAQLRIQNPEGGSGFGGFNKIAKYFLRALPPQILSSLGNTRGAQARNGRIAGLEGDSETGEITVDSIQYDKLAETYEMNDQAARVLVDRAKFDADTFNEIESQLRNEFVSLSKKSQTSGEKAMESAAAARNSGDITEANKQESVAQKHFDRAKELHNLSETMSLRMEPPKVQIADDIIEHVSEVAGNAAGTISDFKKQRPVEKIVTEYYKSGGSMDMPELIEALKQTGAVPEDKLADAAKAIRHEFANQLGANSGMKEFLTKDLTVSASGELGRLIGQEISKSLEQSLDAGFKVGSDATRRAIEDGVGNLLKQVSKSKPELFQDARGEPVYKADVDDKDNAATIAEKQAKVMEAAFKRIAEAAGRQGTVVPEYKPPPPPPKK